MLIYTKIMCFNPVGPFFFELRSEVYINNLQSIPELIDEIIRKMT